MSDKAGIICRPTDVSDALREARELNADIRALGWRGRMVTLGYASGAIPSIKAGYLLNRYFTFGGNERGCFYRQMAGHFGVHLTGGMINYGGLITKAKDPQSVITSLSQK